MRESNDLNPLLDEERCSDWTIGQTGQSLEPRARGSEQCCHEGCHASKQGCSHRLSLAQEDVALARPVADGNRNVHVRNYTH